MSADLRGAFLGSEQAAAQQATALITGTVKDSTVAVVAGARVTATNASTSATRGFRAKPATTCSRWFRHLSGRWRRSALRSTCERGSRSRSTRIRGAYTILAHQLYADLLDKRASTLFVHGKQVFAIQTNFFNAYNHAQFFNPTSPLSTGGSVGGREIFGKATTDRTPSNNPYSCASFSLL